MTHVTPTVPSEGDEANATDVSIPIQQIADVVNGDLDDSNINYVSGSKLVDGTVVSAKIADSNVTLAKINGGTTAGVLQTNSSGNVTALSSWTSYTPTFGGFSVTPTGYIARYMQIGKTVTVTIGMPNTGTSNSTSFTITAPFTSLNMANARWFGPALLSDNSAIINQLGIAIIAANSNVITIYKDNSGAAFTAANGKSASFTVTYEAA